MFLPNRRYKARSCFLIVVSELDMLKLSLHVFQRQKVICALCIKDLRQKTLQMLASVRMIAVLVKKLQCLLLILSRKIYINVHIGLKNNCCQSPYVPLFTSISPHFGHWKITWSTKHCTQCYFRVKLNSVKIYDSYFEWIQVKDNIVRLQVSMDITHFMQFLNTHHSLYENLVELSRIFVFLQVQSEVHLIGGKSECSMITANVCLSKLNNIV